MSVKVLYILTAICYCNLYYLLLGCNPYWEACRSYILYIICYSIVAILVDLNPQKWITVFLFESFVTCIETHNELRYGVAKLAGKAFTPAHVRNNPNLHGSRCAGGEGQRRSKRESCGGTTSGRGGVEGDLLIRYLWTQGTDSIYDMHVVNTDAISYQTKTL